MRLISIELPKPSSQGSISLEKAIGNRESVRSFTKQALSLDLIGQILWAGQGLRGSANRRNVPSAGALYPLELYLVTEEGVYHYIPKGHRMEPHVEGDVRSSLSNAALGQEFIAQAPATYLLTAVFSRIETKYGKERSPQYIYLEAGHAAQNILLQATALGLDGVPVGAFYEEQVSKALRLPREHYPLYLISLGFAEQVG
ncbi:MAG: SagB/ThcOx family dehydrogenase [Anaerolineales bacterium]|nr:SagB/ThcOx family dehydrogenase [Anaerolineales bacterium]